MQTDTLKKLFLLEMSFSGICLGADSVCPALAPASGGPAVDTGLSPGRQVLRPQASQPSDTWSRWRGTPPQVESRSRLPVSDE